MTDLINRADLIAHLNACLAESDGHTPLTDAVLMAVKCAVEQMPTIDAVEVVHGHWVQRWTGNEYIVFCSKCRTEATEIADYELEYNYCPNCGAKMDGCDEE